MAVYRNWNGTGCSVALISSSIASMMNAPKEAFDGTVAYIRICGIGIICIILFNAISGILHGISDSRTPLILMGISFQVRLCMFAVSSFHGSWLAGFFTADRKVMLAAADYLKSNIFS